MSRTSGADHITRRTFLGSLAGAGLGTLGLASCARAGATGAAAPGIERLGVQLYTVRDRMERGVAPTLQAVANSGYAEVETAGLFNVPPQEFRALLDRAGLVSPSGHYSLDSFRENLDATLATAQALGQQWAVVPSLSAGERNAAGYRRLAADLNRFGAAARERGLRVGYHNHDYEFSPLEGGGTGYDILLANTAPELVDLELDLYWAVKAGRDPLALFAAHPGRFPLWHVKDLADPQGTQRMVPVGQGTIDFGALFARRQQAGLRHFYVEHDNAEDSLASIRASRQYLQQLLSL